MITALKCDSESDGRRPRRCWLEVSTLEASGVPEMALAKPQDASKASLRVAPRMRRQDR